MQALVSGRKIIRKEGGAQSCLDPTVAIRAWNLRQFQKSFSANHSDPNRMRRHWSYMSDDDNVSVGQSYIEMKIELAFAAGVSMSFDRSVQHDFILTYATFYRTLFRVANVSVLAISLSAKRVIPSGKIGKVGV